MIKAHLDFEIRSRISLKKSNVSVYAKHPTTSVLCLAYALDDGPIKIWVPGDSFPFPKGEPIRFYAWNAEFEYTIWNQLCVREYGWPPIDARFFRDVQALAAYYGYPRKLEKAAPMFDVAKDKEGHKLMMKLSVPQKGKVQGNQYVGGKFTEITDELQARLNRYCMTDVEVERIISDRLGELPPLVNAYWQANLKINQTGIPIDPEFCMGGFHIFEEEKKRATKRLSKITNGEITTVNQGKRYHKFLNERGIYLTKDGKPSLAKDIVEANADKHEILQIRQLCNSSAPSKYAAMLNHADGGGVCKNGYSFYGASTGRASGSGVQFHNFKKLRKKADPMVIEAIIDGCRDILDVLYGGKIIAALGDYVRSAIIPFPGEKLVVADLSQIEARIVFWIAGQPADFSHIYEDMAAEIYNIPVESIGKDSTERQTGKAVILGAGFGMGHKKFRVQAAKAGVILTEEFAEKSICAFRTKYPKIVASWRNLMRAFEMAFNHETTVAFDERLTFGYDNGAVWIELPSKRRLYYRNVERTVEDGRPTYYYTGGKGRKKITPPIVIENIVQATAADLFFHAIIDMQTEGYKVILQTHDEIGVSGKDVSVSVIEEMMTRSRPWSTGLKIGAEVKEKNRYYE